MTEALEKAGSLFMLDAEGWVSGVRRVPSPNFDARSPEVVIELVVVHAISLPPNAFGSGDIDRLFTNTLDSVAHPFFATIADLRVSAHFLIARDGRVTQYVSCLQRAWHAGVSMYHGRERCNDFSIGIELEGTDTTPYTDSQYQQLVAVTRTLIGLYPAIADNITGHSDIAPARKTDPGPAFDWPRFRAMLTASSE